MRGVKVYISLTNTPGHRTQDDELAEKHFHLGRDD
jgi:hypothetical protein